MSRPSWKSAVFLCFLLIHHEFIIAKHHASHVVKQARKHVYENHEEKEPYHNVHEEYQPIRVIHDSRGPIYVTHVSPSYFDHVNKDYTGEHSIATSGKHNLTPSAQRTQGGRRRIFGLILLLISIVTTIASISLDTYVSVKGCAGLYPSLNTYENEFETKKRDLERKADLIDRQQIRAKDLKQHLEDTSDLMGNVWDEIERISKIQEEILQALDPKILILMNNKSSEIGAKVRVSEQAAAEWSLEKIDGEFVNIFKNAESVVQTFSPVLLTAVGPIVTKSFKHYKISKIYTALKSSYADKLLKAAPKAKNLLGFTDDIIKAHLKSTAALRYASRTSGALKAVKFLKGAGAVLAVVGIGVDIFNIVSTVLGCKKKRDEAKKALDKLIEADREADTTDKDVKDYLNEVTEFFKTEVNPKVRGEELKQALNGIKDLAESAMGNSPDLRQAVTRLNNFLSNIDNAQPGQTVSLLTELFDGVATVEYTMDCYKNKIKLIGHVIRYCREGTDTFEVLYQEGNRNFPGNSDQCTTKTGLPYTSQQDVLGIVQKAATLQGFSTDCTMNSGTLNQRVCDLKRQGHAASAISEKLSIPEDKVASLLKKCSTALTPREHEQVCNLKKLKLSNKQIADNLQLDEARVSSVVCH